MCKYPSCSESLIRGHANPENLCFADSLRSIIVHSQVLIRLWSEEHVAIYYKLQEAFPK